MISKLRCHRNPARRRRRHDLRPELAGESSVAARRAEGQRRLAGAVAGRRAQDVLHAAGLSPRARRQRAAHPGSHRHGLGSSGTTLGGRDAGLRPGSAGARAEHGSDRQGRRARRHEPRRQDGQAHGIRRRPRARSGAEGPRCRRAGRRAAERLVDEGHERRSEDGQEGAGDRSVRSSRGSRRAEREQLLLGSRQLDVHGQRRRDAPVQGRQVRGAERHSSRGEWGVTQDDAGRIYRNTNESVLHVDLVPTPVLHAQPESAAHARQLRTAGRRGERRKHRLAGAQEPGHQPRVSARYRSRGRDALALHVGLRPDDLSRRSVAVRPLWKRVCGGTGRESRRPRDHR